MLFYGRQDITEEDIRQVAEVLRSDLITTGPVTEEFESAFAAYVGAKHAVALCNATSALHLAMLVAGIGKGDRVVTSPNTFLASANCAAYVGATPDFVDIDPISHNLCPQALAREWKPDTGAVVAVHYAGGPADMEKIAEVARGNNALVIEDACHAVGGSIYKDGALRKIGSHGYADMTVFSFHPVKTMTCGEGGMLVTDNDDYAAKAKQLRTHGMTRNPEDMVGLNLSDLDERGPWYYEMQSLGYNMRITDFQCALGLSQLSRLDQSIRRRREIVATYNQAFSAAPFIKTPVLKDISLQDHTSWHLYTVQIDFETLGLTRTHVMERLHSNGVATQVLYIPVHLQPWYRQTYGYGQNKCPVAEQNYRQTLSLPLYPAMSEGDVQLVIDNVLAVTSVYDQVA